MYQKYDIAAVETSLDELLRAEDLPGALDLLSSSWPSLASIHGCDIRRLIERIPEQYWHRDPWFLAAMGASYRSLDSGTRSAALPWFRTAEAIIATQSPEDDCIVAGVRIHHSAALRSLGRLRESLEAAESAWHLLEGDLSSSASIRIRSQTQAALQIGLVRLHLGENQEALQMLRLALGLSESNLIQSELVECLSGLALLKWFSGDFAAAIELAEEAYAASGKTGLIDSPFGAAAIITQAMVAIEENRVDDALQLSERATKAAYRSDWEPLAEFTRASVSLIEGRYVEGLERVRRSLDSARAWDGPPIVRVMCRARRGAFLMHLGEFASALTEFETIEPTIDHSICPARFIAGIRYKAGDSAGCLAALSACEALGDAHSPRTVVDVLLLRAAANYDLDNAITADVALDRALLLAAASKSKMPFSLVSAVTMHRMLTRAADRSQPAEVYRLLDEMRAGYGAPVSGSLEPLSNRELDIAQHLFEDKTVSQIASELYISTNTVKTHVRSIYRKLAANNRRDAVRRVKELGLHADITPR